jgi:hypothetical protein
MEDMNSQGHLGASQPLAGGGAGSTTALDSSRTGKSSENPDDVPELEAPEDDDPVDETGVDPKDIELVMAQVNCGPTSDFFVLAISYGGERMILFTLAGYCTSVTNHLYKYHSPRSSPDLLVSLRRAAKICPMPFCGVILATAATRYNNLIVPNRSQRSQRLRCLRPRPRLRAEGPISTLAPEQRSVPTREAHLWKTCGSSAVLHQAVHFGPDLSQAS